MASRFLRVPSTLRLRVEYFGAVAWTPGRPEIFRLAPLPTAAALYFASPRPFPPLDDSFLAVLAGHFHVQRGAWDRVVRLLIAQGLLDFVDPSPSLTDDLAALEAAVDYMTSNAPSVPLAKPFWVHLQPFTRCNEHCIHCYCNGGPAGTRGEQPLSAWERIIGELDDYGVRDIYVTGGECLSSAEFFQIAEWIIGRRLGFGLSTNATVITGRVLERLQHLGIKRVQVSLDGACPGTHDRVRGRKGAFARTLEGIRQLSMICEPVVNTVVNAWNLGELQQIIEITAPLGCTSYKFFPQKPVGRARHAGNHLDDETILTRLIPICNELSATYNVHIETTDPKRPCGSGRSGFAIDECGDVFPCIFSVANKALRCGNIFRNSIDDVWFRSPVLAAFRRENGTVCRRCEIAPDENQ